eukprot:CAMPEP_0184490974 /NCGR_PEP_ID=MMETSP0113_2-20130426/19319_1 /TAXON_ID=91329 /ORGANISM="Norrisiella sphaerica, Strain BC52" /LENGTH=235 /DNA_ID=CAMNT_0026875131 /DNA_START=554 /DNA_END=1263 /DNA_ORIENTATION=+
MKYRQKRFEEAQVGTGEEQGEKLVYPQERKGAMGRSTGLGEEDEEDESGSIDDTLRKVIEKKSDVAKDDHLSTSISPDGGPMYNATAVAEAVAEARRRKKEAKLKEEYEKYALALGTRREKFEFEFVPEDLKIREQLVPPVTKKRTLFIGNLPMEFRTPDLIDLVQPYGEFEDCFICLGQKALEEGWRYGFVKFKELKDAQKAMNDLNCIKINGQDIIVEPSRFNPLFDRHEAYR